MSEQVDPLAELREMSPSDRLAAWASELLVVEHRPGELTAAGELLADTLPFPGRWRYRRSKFGKSASTDLIRGLDREERVVAGDALAGAVRRAPGVVARAAVHRETPGHVLAWTWAVGDALLLCWTREQFRRLGLQTLLWRDVFAASDGRPRSVGFEPRGAHEFLASLGVPYQRVSLLGEG